MLKYKMQTITNAGYYHRKRDSFSMILYNNEWAVLALQVLTTPDLARYHLN